MRLNSSIKHYSDKLIYDSSHEIDAGVFTVTLPTESKAKSSRNSKKRSDYLL